MAKISIDGKAYPGTWWELPPAVGDTLYQGISTALAGVDKTIRQQIEVVRAGIGMKDGLFISVTLTDPDVLTYDSRLVSLRNYFKGVHGRLEEEVQLNAWTVPEVISAGLGVQSAEFCSVITPDFIRRQTLALIGQMYQDRYLEVRIRMEAIVAQADQMTVLLSAPVSCPG